MVRYQTSEGRDLERGLRLDRNEKVSTFSQEVLNDIFSSFQGFSLSASPDAASLYEKISGNLNIDKDHIFVTAGITEGIRSLTSSSLFLVIPDIASKFSSDIVDISLTVAMLPTFNISSVFEVIPIFDNSELPFLTFSPLASVRDALSERMSTFHPDNLAASLTF